MNRPAEHTAVEQIDSCAPGMVRRVAAMLDLDANGFKSGNTLPRGWHFFLLGGDTRRSNLRSDGFPGFGLPIPDFDLPRLMFAGRKTEYRADLTIGGTVHRRSALLSVAHKSTASGKVAIVTIGHELRDSLSATPAILEEQTFILLNSLKPKEAKSAASTFDTAEQSKTVLPDETLLFQFSALGFNSHKIHLDRTYAVDVEGLPGLVVNGGLTMLLMTEFLRRELRSIPRRIAAKHIAPLYCGRPITLGATRIANGWKLQVHDDLGTLAIDAEVEVV